MLTVATSRLTAAANLMGGCYRNRRDGGAPAPRGRRSPPTARTEVAAHREDGGCLPAPASHAETAHAKPPRAGRDCDLRDQPGLNRAGITSNSGLAVHSHDRGA